VYTYVLYVLIAFKRLNPDVFWIFLGLYFSHRLVEKSSLIWVRGDCTVLYVPIVVEDPLFTWYIKEYSNFRLPIFENTRDGY
jgi:hypothetical protein